MTTKSKKLTLVLAVADNGVIGAPGKLLPWRLPNDLEHFKRLTLGKPMIMGRKTYDTIGRPLPGRHNILISRNPDFKVPGADVVGSLEEALSLARKDPGDEIMVAGGASVFEQLLPSADTIYLTEVHAEPHGHVHFRFDRDDWEETSRNDHPADQRNEHPYSFVTLLRKH